MLLFDLNFKLLYHDLFLHLVLDFLIDLLNLVVIVGDDIAKLCLLHCQFMNLLC